MNCLNSVSPSEKTCLDLFANLTLLICFLHSNIYIDCWSNPTNDCIDFGFFLLLLSAWKILLGQRQIHAPEKPSSFLFYH